MTASLGKGISIAIVGAFFGWNAGLFGTTLNSLNPSIYRSSQHVAADQETVRVECPAYFAEGFFSRNSLWNQRAWCDQYRNQIGGDLPMRRIADYLPDIPIWGYALIVLAAMIAMPPIYHWSVGLAVLYVGGWLAWQGVAAVI